MRSFSRASVVAKQFIVVCGLVALPGLAAAEEALQLGINQGLSEPLSGYDRQERYQAFSDYISNALKRPVRFEVFQHVKGRPGDPKKARYDIAFVRPSSNAALALRDRGSQLIASAKGELNAYFIASDNNVIRSAADLRGKRIAMPAPSALVSHVGLASLRDLGMDPAEQKITHTNFQEQAVYMVEQKLADVAVVGPLVAKKMQAKGAVVVHKSKAVPTWALIAAPWTSQADVEKIRAAVIALSDSESGRKILRQIEVEGFQPAKRDQYLAMLDWLKI